MTLIVPADDLRRVLMVGAAVGDEDLEQVSATAQASFLRYLRTKDDDGNVIDYSDFPEVKEGITAVAVDYFGARRAPGGQASALDATPVPRISAFIVQRAVASYALQHMDSGAFFA